MKTLSDLLETTKNLANQWRDRLVDFAGELISIPSLSGNEGDVAKAILRCMAGLGYDEVRTDEVGNVTGVVHGRSREPGVVLNGHMDTVPPADMPDPFRPGPVDASKFGRRGLAITGRGACDMKGPLASMVLAGGMFRQMGVRPLHDFIVTASILEEVGGSIGSSHLIKTGLRGRLAVMAEPTNLRINLGHRGSVHVDITTVGKAAHASTPESGENAIYLMAPVIQAIENLNPHLPGHPSLGRATLAACDIKASPGARNVVPSACVLSVNFRTVPGMDEAAVLALLQKTVSRTLGVASPPCRVELAVNEGSTYTGVEFRTPRVMRGFWSEPTGPAFEALKMAAILVTGRDVQEGLWRFSTDGPCFSIDGGIPTYGFGPGDESVAHSSLEHVLVEDLVTAAATYALTGFLV